MNDIVNWIFGRGASIASDLSWSVPEGWQTLDRDLLISKIKNQVSIEMKQSTTEVYKKFLSILSNKSRARIKHLFITTNWDYLLQKAINEQDYKVLPPWLLSSHVYHLNGTVENLHDNSKRSQFLLEIDPATKRIPTFEANQAYGRMIWSSRFIIIGMSFECRMDKGLLAAFNRVEDNLPIGFSEWIIVNSNSVVLKQVEENLKVALPKCRVKIVHSRFEEWIDTEMSILNEVGILET